MTEPVSDHDPEIMALARRIADRLDHPYLGTEHMLLALLNEEDGGGAEVLGRLDVDLQALHEALEPGIRPPEDAAPHAPKGQLPLTPSAQLALELCQEECATLGHEHIGSEHLLLGMIRATASTAGAILREAGVTLEAARASLTTP